MTRFYAASPSLSLLLLFLASVPQVLAPNNPFAAGPLESKESVFKAIESFITSRAEHTHTYLHTLYPPFYGRLGPKKKALYDDVKGKINSNTLLSMVKYVPLKLDLEYKDFKTTFTEVFNKDSAIPFVYGQNGVNGNPTDNKVHVHVNFAHQNAFMMYNVDGRFAQDEIQTAEIPIIACALRFLQAENPFSPNTMAYAPGFFKTLDEKDRTPTPILIRNARRLYNFNTTDIYGDNFGRADIKKLKKQSRPLKTPQWVNILAIVAPDGGVAGSIYTEKTLDEMLWNVVTGFLAAKLEIMAAYGPNVKTVIHTGNWGTGAFGNNLDVISRIQLAAAKIANVDELVYYPMETSQQKTWAGAIVKLNEGWETGKSVNVAAFIKNLQDEGLKWLKGNGT